MPYLAGVLTGVLLTILSVFVIDHHYAYSSLFWCFADGVPASAALPSFSIHQPTLETSTIRRLVSWFDSHYRVGYHFKA
jgi:hypothetical protein